MNSADTAYMRAFADALALAERAGTAILAGSWGHPTILPQVLLP